MSALFGDVERFKVGEEEFSSYLPSESRAVIRFDGNNFSRYTKSFRRPYDTEFMGFMDHTAKQICELISGVHFAYVQSDEISVVFSDISPSGDDKAREMWFGGRVNKILSVGAAPVSTVFARFAGVSSSGQIPVFDARVQTLSDSEEVEDYVRWRRFDAQKNSVTMAVSVLHSPSELHGVSSKERLGLLRGSEWERLPEGFYNGRVVFKRPSPMLVETPNGTIEVIRNSWVVEPATREFMETKFVSLNR